MELSQELEDYIKESIEDTLGLTVSTHTMEMKLRATEEDCRSLRDQNMDLQERLNERDDAIELARAEASLNAQAVRKFVEGNQKLAMECHNLSIQCTKWEKECLLYDHDREALMDFANEADERAEDAETRVHELECELRRLSEKLQFYKDQRETQLGDSTAEGSSLELFLVESLVTLVGNHEAAPVALAFLEANNGVEVCQRLHQMWDSLRPSTQKVLALIAELKHAQKDKDHLRINLTRAEEEVNILFEENKLLNKENKRLMRHEKERRHSGSGEKPTSSASASDKMNKRKSSPKMSSLIERQIDFINVDSPRKPLSPLQHNSPKVIRAHKK